MTVATVVNCRASAPQGTTLFPIPDVVLIDRTTKWGNPFHVGRDGTRDEVIVKYLRWIATQPELLAAIGELRGKRLACWCAPRPCHGDVLALLANATADPGCPCGWPNRTCRGGVATDRACPAGHYRSA